MNDEQERQLLAQIEALSNEQDRLRRNLLAQQKLLSTVLTLMLKSGILDKKQLIDNLKANDLVR